MITPELIEEKMRIPEYASAFEAVDADMNRAAVLWEALDKATVERRDDRIAVLLELVAEAHASLEESTAAYNRLSVKHGLASQIRRVPYRIGRLKRKTLPRGHVAGLR